MIRLLDGMPEGVLGFDASGKDYIQVLAPQPTRHTDQSVEPYWPAGTASSRHGRRLVAIVRTNCRIRQRGVR